MYLFLLMFASAAAQETTGSSKGGLSGMANLFMPFILIIIVFYFLMIRPQQKQRAKHEEFLKSLKRGDEVVTSSGIIGVVDSISDNIVTIQIDNDVKIKVLKGTVSASAKLAAKGN